MNEAFILYIHEFPFMTPHMMSQSACDQMWDTQICSTAHEQTLNVCTDFPEVINFCGALTEILRHGEETIL